MLQNLDLKYGSRKLFAKWQMKVNPERFHNYYTNSKNLIDTEFTAALHREFIETLKDPKLRKQDWDW